MTAQPLYTLARYAIALGITARAARKGFGRRLRAAGDEKQISGRLVRACPLAELPPLVRQRLVAKAAAARCRDADEWLERCTERREPELPAAQWPPAALEKAVRRREALAPLLRTAAAANVSALTRAARRRFARLCADQPQSERSVRRWLERAQVRDRGRGEWERLELCLDDRPPRGPADPGQSASVHGAGILREALGLLGPTARSQPGGQRPSVACRHGGNRPAGSAGTKRTRGPRPGARSPRSIGRAAGPQPCGAAKVAAAQTPWLAAEWRPSGRSAGPASRRLGPLPRPRLAGRGAAAPARPRAGLRRTARPSLPRVVGRRTAASGLLPDLHPRCLRQVARAQGRPRVLPGRLPGAVAAGAPRQKGHRVAWPQVRARDWSAMPAGVQAQSDDCTLPVYFWVPAENGCFKLLRGQFLPWVDTRTTCIHCFQFLPTESYGSLDIVRGVVRLHDEFGLPPELYFERGIWQRSPVIAGRGDEAPWKQRVYGLRDLGIRRSHALDPSAKVVERVLGALQNRMERERGYCGRDERRDCPAAVAKAKRALEAGRCHPGEWFYSCARVGRAA